MGHKHSHKIDPQYLDPGKARLLQGVFLATGFLFAVLSLLIFWIASSQDGGEGFSIHRTFGYAWLFAFSACYTPCIGALFWILVHHAADASWSVAVRRILENIAALFPWLLILFLPLFYFAPWIWKWMTITPGHDALLDHKSAYLNISFFWIRAAFYLLFFSAAGFIFRKLSISQDRDANPYHSLRMRKMAYAGIPLLALSTTFSGFDWLMSLDHHWFSTMWGVYIFAGSILSGMALLVLISHALRWSGYLHGIVTEEHDHIMGKLLFAFIVFWGYIAFSQYFLIYYANIPEETIFYTYRNEGEWRWMSIFLTVGHFVIPFIWLLTQPAKRVPWRICLGAGWILFMHLVDLYWIIMPMRQVLEKEDVSHSVSHAEKLLHTSGHIDPHWLDLTCVLALIGFLGFAFMRHLSKHSLFPVRDFRLKESIHIKN